MDSDGPGRGVARVTTTLSSCPEWCVLEGGAGEGKRCGFWLRSYSLETNPCHARGAGRAGGELAVLPSLLSKHTS